MRYTQVKRSEADRKSLKYFDKIGFTYTDTFLRERGGGVFRIVDIVRCESYKKGKNSKTLFYQIFDTVFYAFRPVRDNEYEFIPCMEVYGHRSTVWIEVVSPCRSY